VSSVKFLDVFTKLGKLHQYVPGGFTLEMAEAKPLHVYRTMQLHCLDSYFKLTLAKLIM
jgi:hypothetical protein